MLEKKTRPDDWVNPYPYITTRMSDPRYMDRVSHACYEQGADALIAAGWAEIPSEEELRHFLEELDLNTLGASTLAQHIHYWLRTHKKLFEKIVTEPGGE